MALSAEPGQQDRIERSSTGYQLIQALVGIRLRSVADPESRRHLTWLSDVIAAMTLINRRISDGGPAEFALYLEDTASFWRRNIQDKAIRIDIRASDAPLPESHALPLAIIAHELISNAVRHGFPAGRRGSIAIAYSRASDGVSLVVRDSGQGSSDLQHGDGLSLVSGLVQHLGGSMAIDTTPEAGVGIGIRLPISPIAHH